MILGMAQTAISLKILCAVTAPVAKGRESISYSDSREMRSRNDERGAPGLSWCPAGTASGTRGSSTESPFQFHQPDPAEDGETGPPRGCAACAALLQPRRVPKPGQVPQGGQTSPVVRFCGAGEVPEGPHPAPMSRPFFIS